MTQIWLLVKLLKDIPKVWRITNKNPKCPAYSVSIHLRFRIYPGTMNLILVPLNIPPCWSFTGQPELSNPDVANTWKIPHRIQELWRITIIQTQILIKAQVRLAIKKLQKRRRGIHHKILCSLGKSHYSKSQIFVQKFNFDKTPIFSRVFHPNFFWQFFSWNQSCQQLKSPKPQHFHKFFT